MMMKEQVEYSYKSFSIYDHSLIEKLKKISNLYNEEYLELDFFSPFVYKLFNPDFEINQKHYNHIILEQRFIQEKIAKNYNFNKSNLNCFLIYSQYDAKENDILFSLTSEFLDFVENHQILVSKNLMYFNRKNCLLSMMYDFYLSSLLFDSKNKKVKGHLNLENQYYNLFGKSENSSFDGHENIFYYKNDEFFNWLFKNKIYLYYDFNCLKIKSHILEKFSIPKEKKEIENLIINFNSDKDHLEFHFIEFINQFDKLKKTKQQYFISILTDDIVINKFLICQMLMETLNESINTLKNIKNFSNTIRRFKIWHNFLIKPENHENLINKIDNSFKYLNISLKRKITKIKDIIKIFDWIENEYKHTQNYHFAFGFLEDFDFFNNDFNDVIETLKSKVKNKNLKENEKLVTPLKTISSFYGFTIMELKTKKQQNNEAKFMMNCIGGKVINENSRMFSVRWEVNNVEYRHCIHFVKMNNYWKIRESRGFKNVSKESYDEMTKATINSIEQKILKDFRKKSKSIKEIENEAKFLELED